MTTIPSTVKLSAVVNGVRITGVVYIQPGLIVVLRGGINTYACGSLAEELHLAHC